MKQILLTLALAAAFTTGAHAQAPAPAPQQQVENQNAPRFKFKGGETHNFGTLKEGPVAEYAFEFTNTGKEPLVIQAATASCGCTVPEWPKEPILPGKKGKITVRYNTQGRPGPFDKTIFITSNAARQAPGKERYELVIKGTVSPAAQASGNAAK